jgi:hypothetical protein
VPNNKAEKIKTILRSKAMALLKPLYVSFAVLLLLLVANTTKAQITLETDDFRLVCDNKGFLKECIHLPSNTRFNTGEWIWSSVANWDDFNDWPDSMHVVQLSPTEFSLTYIYDIEKSLTLKVTQYKHFLEFELIDVIGDCGQLVMFRLFFVGNRSFNTHNQYYNEQLMKISDGFFAVMIAGNPETHFMQWQQQELQYEMIGAISPEYLPTPTRYVRNQKFALFICAETELKQRIEEVEAFYSYPIGMNIKDNIENDIDYLFLLNRNDASAQDIIDLCKQTGLGNVLLLQWVWADWDNPMAPFLVRPGMKQFVDSLKAEGLLVGLHSYVHKVRYKGYYDINYPELMGAIVENEVHKNFDWDSGLPELIAAHYVISVKELDIDWVYFDGSEFLYNENDKVVATYDWYMKHRMTKTVMQLLRQEGIVPVIHQESSSHGAYHFISRSGQIDYIDNFYWPVPESTPIKSINYLTQNVEHIKSVFQTPDLGWFGREIHVWDPNNQRFTGRRDATWEEWQYLCNASLKYDIPLGIRTTYDDFMSDSLKNRIIPLLYQTIQTRRLPTSIFQNSDDLTISSFRLEQNYPNPFNPETTIRFRISKVNRVVIRIFNILGKQIRTLADGYYSAGHHTVHWDAKDVHGNNVSSGIYIYRLQIGNFVQSRKMILLR